MSDTSASGRKENDTDHERTHVSESSKVACDGGLETIADTYDDAGVRDRAWSAAVRLGIRRYPLGFRLFQVRDEAALPKSKDRTIRRTLNAMRELGWLDRDDGGQYWGPGEVLDEIVAERETAGDDEAIEILDDRIDYYEEYTARDRAHDESLSQRKAELELVRRRIANGGDDR